MTHILYSPDLEELLPDEEQLLSALETVMVDLADKVHVKRGHAFQAPRQAGVPQPHRLNAFWALDTTI